MKTFKDILNEANSSVPRIAPEEGIDIHAKGDAVFIDVRDSKMLASSGTIKGAHHIPRGMIELSADPNTPYHKPVLQKDAQICIVCGGGVMAAMTGKTLQDMGFTNITNVGGMQAWIDAGGPTEDAK